jgi:hypothetical protein
MNELKIVMEQTEDGVLLSRLTLEYPGLENADANNINITLVGGMLAAVRGLADAKAAGTPAHAPDVAKGVIR